MSSKKARRGGSDWNVGPVLREKLNSQGTLFRGGTKFSSDKRYPRGYTPERQKEVADQVVQPSVQNYFGKPSETSYGTQSKNFKDRRINVALYPEHYPEGYRMESAQPVRDLVDNIARSTVPVQHLRGVQFRTSADVHLQSNDPTIQIAGHYDTKGDALSKGDAVIRLRSGVEQGFTPIHEIGHHVSANEGYEHSLYQTAYQRGQEEGFADAYGVEHARNKEGKRVSALRRYPSGIVGSDPQRRMNFESAYAKAREHVPYPLHERPSPPHPVFSEHQAVDRTLSAPSRMQQATLFTTVEDRSTEQPAHNPDFQFLDPNTLETIGHTSKWETQRKRLRWEARNGF